MHPLEDMAGFYGAAQSWPCTSPCTLLNLIIVVMRRTYRTFLAINIIPMWCCIEYVMITPTPPWWLNRTRDIFFVILILFTMRRRMRDVCQGLQLPAFTCTSETWYLYEAIWCSLYQYYVHCDNIMLIVTILCSLWHYDIINEEHKEV